MSAFDLSGAVGAMANASYTVTRLAVGSYSSGIWAPGSSSSVTIKASVQPLSSRELAILPEGLRTMDSRYVYTTSPLFTKTASNEPDKISIDGETYQIHQVQQWGGISGWYRALAVKETIS